VFVVHTTIPLDPEQEARARSLATDLADAARDVEGVVRYRPALALGDDPALQFFEQYADEAAVEAKEALPEYDAFASALPELAAGDLETVQVETDDATAVQFDAEAAVPGE